ncbi:MAG: CopG family ribbon-helix-helix protein [Promethearchaeota archaeon]
MEEYKRFTVSVPQEMYERFETFRKKLDISRSDCIRKAMQTYMIREETIFKSSVEVVGCIAIVMTHEHFDLSHQHSNDFDHQDKNYHDHEYSSISTYANVQQTDLILNTDIQHHFRDIIISTMHIHLEFEKCLEIIAVSGSYKRIVKLKDNLQKLKSVISIGFFIIDKENNKRKK